MTVPNIQVGDGLLIALYVVTLGVLLAYSANFFYLTWAAWRRTV